MAVAVGIDLGTTNSVIAATEAGKPASKLELTQIYTRSEPWWTLGIEARGPASLLRRELEATAALMVAQALPDGIELSKDHSTSYAQWLRRAAVASCESCAC